MTTQRSTAFVRQLIRLRKQLFVQKNTLKKNQDDKKWVENEREKLKQTRNKDAVVFAEHTLLDLEKLEWHNERALADLSKDLTMFEEIRQAQTKEIDQFEEKFKALSGWTVLKKSEEDVKNTEMQIAGIEIVLAKKYFNKFKIFASKKHVLFERLKDSKAEDVDDILLANPTRQFQNRFIRIPSIKDTVNSLMLAIINKKPKAVPTLIKFGAKLNEKSKERGYTALHYAVLYEQWDSLEALLTNKANPLEKNNDNQTPLELFETKDFSFTKFLEFRRYKALLEDAEKNYPFKPQPNAAQPKK